MAYTYKTMYAHASNYYSSTTRPLKNIKKVVIHWTGNNGDNALNNAKYFQSAKRNASAHYFIDDDYVICSVKDTYSAWAVGGGLKDQKSSYAKNGAKYYKKYTNSNTLSIELCDTVKDGVKGITKKTRENAVAFTAKKLKELGLDAGDLIRHFDINGKLCPIYFVTDEADWNKFKKEVATALEKLNAPKVTKNIPKLATPTLKKGSKGTQVGYLQQDLNYVMKSGLKVDKVFGNSTYNALIKFQTKYKLTADGIYGPKSQAKMKSLLK